MQQKYKMAFIQLTRIGDVIQTFTAARQLKNENPNVELTLIARKKFAYGLDFLLRDTFDNIVYFDTQEFFETKNLNSARAEVHNFIHDLNKYEFDIVMNLSFNKSSSFLASLINAKHKMGLYRNKHSELAVNDKWSQFIYSNVMASTLNPFNLVDIYKHISGAKEIDVTTYQVPKDGIITIHPFASSKKKSWGVNKWNEVIYKLLKDRPDISIILVGAPNDEEKAKQITDSPMLANFNERILNNVSKNSIEDTFHDLSRSQLFIGHDSMVSHLASLFRMPSLIISLGTVRPHESSPYNDRAYILAPRNKCFPCTVRERCDLLPCHSSINHQVVVAAAKNLLDKNEFDWKDLSQHVTPFHIDNVSIYKSSFDEFGIKLTEITKNNVSHKDVFRAMYRIIWSYYLANIEVTTDIPDFNNDTLRILNNHLEGTNYLFELYGHGFNFCNRILDETEKETPEVKEIQNGVTKVAEIDGLCNITKRSFSQLAPLIDFFYVNRANAEGENIIEITNNNLISFHDSSNIVAILADLIEKTIGPRIGTVNRSGTEV